MIALVDVKTGRSTCISALRAFAVMARALNVPFPRRGSFVHVAAGVFFVAKARRVTNLKGSTLRTYLAALRRFARLALGEAEEEAYDNHPLSALVMTRVERMSDPSTDTRLPFAPGQLHAALADPGADAAVRAVCAVAWDGLSRLGALLEECTPASSGPLPVERLTMVGTAMFPAFELVIQDKLSPKGEVIRVSSDPGSAWHHPASCGAARLVMEYMDWRRARATGPLWLTAEGTAVDKDMVVAHMRRHAGPHVTGHCFRVSSASWLYQAGLATMAQIQELGRWGSISSVRTYVRCRRSAAASASEPADV